MNLTDENKEKLNALYKLMCKQNVTKQMVMQIFKINERTARDMISEIAKRAPVIAVSDSKGYRIAVSIKDTNEAKHAFLENKKRAEEIMKRNAPLKQFLEENLI